jgi:Zn finger protein HypA/HybF involved in hydrogenase expression
MSQATCQETNCRNSLSLHEMPLPCPHCGGLTHSLKRYRVFDFLLCLFIGFSMQTVMHTACPGCMRKSLLIRSLINLPLANVLFPLVAVFHGIAFLRSLTQGHSESVVEILRGQS